MNCVGSLTRQLARGGSCVGNRPASLGRGSTAAGQGSHPRARARGLSSRLFQKVTAGSALAFLQQPRLHCFFNRSPAFKTKSHSLETSRACAGLNPRPRQP